MAQRYPTRKARRLAGIRTTSQRESVAALRTQGAHYDETAKRWVKS